MHVCSSHHVTGNLMLIAVNQKEKALERICSPYVLKPTYDCILRILPPLAEKEPFFTFYQISHMFQSLIWNLVSCNFMFLMLPLMLLCYLYVAGGGAEVASVPECRDRVLPTCNVIRT